jgi:hypothetical protein
MEDANGKTARGGRKEVLAKEGRQRPNTPQQQVQPEDQVFNV